MDMDLRQRLDSSFGDGPEHRPLAATLHAGRRAHRRRRAGEVAAAAALLVSCLTAAPFLTGDHGDAGEPITRVTPTQTALGVPRSYSLPVDTSWTAECGPGHSITCEDYAWRYGPVTFRADGTLVARSADVHVWKLAQSPVESPGDVVSAAVEAELDGHLRWWLVILTSDGRVGTRDTNPSGIGFDFNEWTTHLRNLRSEKGILFRPAS